MLLSKEAALTLGWVRKTAHHIASWLNCVSCVFKSGRETSRNLLLQSLGLGPSLPSTDNIIKELRISHALKGGCAQPGRYGLSYWDF
jgi:hypothetical protein